MEEVTEEKPQTPKGGISRRTLLGAAAAFGASRVIPEVLFKKESGGGQITPPVIFGSFFELPLDSVLDGQYHKPKPIAGFRVALSKMRKTERGFESVGNPKFTQTYKDGIYLFEGVEPGLYQVGHGHVDTAKDPSFLQLGRQFRDHVEITDQTRLAFGSIFIKMKTLKQEQPPQTLPDIKNL